MSGFLLDINVVYEIVKPSPERRVSKFLTDPSDLWLSVIVQHEITFGTGSLRQGQRRNEHRSPTRHNESPRRRDLQGNV